MWSRLYESGSQLEPNYISTALDVVVGKLDPLSLSIAATRAIAIDLQRQPLYTRQRSLCYLFKSSVVPLSRRKRKDNRVSIYKEKESLSPSGRFKRSWLSWQSCPFANVPQPPASLLHSRSLNRISDASTVQCTRVARVPTVSPPVSRGMPNAEDKASQPERRKIVHQP